MCSYRYKYTVHIHRPRVKHACGPTVSGSFKDRVSCTQLTLYTPLWHVNNGKIHSQTRQHTVLSQRCYFLNGWASTHLRDGTKHIVQSRMVPTAKLWSCYRRGGELAEEFRLAVLCNFNQRLGNDIRDSGTSPNNLTTEQQSIVAPPL